MATTGGGEVQPITDGCPCDGLEDGGGEGPLLHVPVELALFKFAFSYQLDFLKVTIFLKN